MVSPSTCVDPLTRGLRECAGDRPNLAEADKQTLREVFSLRFSGDGFADAITSVIVDRDMLRHLLAAQRYRKFRSSHLPSRRAESTPQLSSARVVPVEVDQMPDRRKRPRPTSVLVGWTARARTPIAVTSIAAQNVAIATTTTSGRGR